VDGCEHRTEVRPDGVSTLRLVVQALCAGSGSAWPLLAVVTLVTLVSTLGAHALLGQSTKLDLAVVGKTAWTLV
jgi:hypothetical protein